ncbi:hypothetical protein K432DRAFT_289345 [Lepidopterella palustris CBS 459.81]|uniref:Uncharacterized protein n=1 Tax=Lepidopterella palustris CBS 459.81 TaxID=1314670 RepID=A0A8E2JJD9_9PEZI|nr:hypothetical protein K432DRAFT_289345 [Lepidopterella palustris CBS 459.81]
MQSTGTAFGYNGVSQPTSSGNPSTVYEPASSSTSSTDDSSHHKAIYSAAIVLPIIFLGILGVLVFLYIRRRRRQKAQIQMQEMKMQSNTSTQPHYAAPPVLPPPTVSLITPQPVILGPISGSSNGAYYTGIDTSDVVSVHDTMGPNMTGLGNPFADSVDNQEEPPPPYRPRSLAPPISRDTSLRQTPPAALSQTNLMAAHLQNPRSPFADPHDDDAISEVSEPTGPRVGRRNDDEFSAVSDISYQQDPVISRPAV